MIDPILASVFARAFKSITDEMSISLQRTTRSPILCEAKDFVTGLYDAEGAIALRLFAAPGPPDDAWWRAAIEHAVQAEQLAVESLRCRRVVGQQVAPDDLARKAFAGWRLGDRRQIDAQRSAGRDEQRAERQEGSAYFTYERHGRSLLGLNLGTSRYRSEEP